MAPYQISRVEDRLVVSFGNVPEPPGPQILVAEKTAQAPAAAKPPIPPAATAKGTMTNVLTGVDFKQLEDKSRIIIGLPEGSAFESQRMGKKMVAVDIRNTFVPKGLQRPLDTSEFESAINSINIQNIKTAKGNDVRILIKLREEVAFETTKEGRQLFIDIEKPKKVETKMEPASKAAKEAKEEVKKEEPKKEEAIAPEVKEGRREPPTPAAVEEKPGSPALEPKKGEEPKKTSEEGTMEKPYVGRKVSLDFKDADIKNILRLIAEVSNLNIIAGEEVAGKITMRLVDVPWDQALDVVLQARALGMSRVGNVIRVAPLEMLKKEAQGELEAKRVKERLEDLVIELIPVNYATAKELIAQVKSVLSDRGDVKVDDRTNILIVKDIPRSLGGAKSLVKSLDTKTPQVLIEARIVEANLTFQRELGVSWGAVIGGGTATLQGGLLGNRFVDLPALPKTGTAGIFEFLFNRGTIRDLDIAISAHESKGDVRIVSSPRIATLDNKEASIEQGLRIPYKKQTADGNVSVDFIEANLKLTVLPHVTNDGHIKLSIKAKKDAPDRTIEVEGTPSIDKKEVISEVLIRDGGVVVIAGVYSIQKSETTEGVPLFNRIPLLGWLFKREAKEDLRKDLLIFICPKIIRDQA
jgi:type IV pilus assembly protein PilQ